MASKTVAGMVALALSVTLVAACSSSGNSKGSSSPTTVAAQNIDYKKLGLWNDGPCDPSKPPLKLGLMTVFESPVISLKDQADALQASAKAFNARGGANGSCIQVTTCDDKAQTDQAIACVRTIDSAGVVATVNDQGTAGQAEVSAAMQKAGIPRVAANVTNVDWSDPNAYPLDGSGTGSTFMMPETLVQSGVKKMGDVRVDLAAASALKGLLNGVYQKDGASITYDVPVPAGTTDYSQFILGAQSAGVGGLFIPLGEQEAVQVVKAAQQLGSNLKLGTTLGTFGQKDVAGLGDFAKNMSFIWSYPPATATSVPVYQAMRADLAASGEQSLQPENLKSSPAGSWIGLYALLRMIRDAKLTTFTRPAMTAMLKKAKNVPMLGMFGGENWTPDTNHQGLFKRAGLNNWEVWKWDPNAPSPTGVKGNFVRVATLNWDKVMCGSMFGSPGPC
jgi:ABC-type branched-subunit amino acid transport system substrate-binding protein